MKKTIATEKVTCGTISSQQIENTNPVNVFIPGKSDPVEAEVTFRLSEDDVTNYMNIMSITPNDQNPVLYWHQVAMDAIKSQESAQNRAKQADADRAKAQRAFDDLTEKTAQKIADYKMRVDKETQEVPFDLSRLVGMARSGDVDLNVSVQIKGKRRMPQYEYEKDD